jgi:hypothetical protein
MLPARYRGATPRLLTHPVSCLSFVVGLLVVASRLALAAADTLPERLTDQEFWRLSQELSEPNGYFRSDNLLSNELFYPEILPQLLRQAKTGGVYLGVGPEQNFNYIVALRPRMVFITDVRRGNLQTQLMYKALFEMSADRADFFSKLFTKRRPDGLTDATTAMDLVARYWDPSAVTLGEDVYKRNLQAIKDHLTKSPHQLPLPKEDLDGIEYVYYNFYWFGPSITYNSSTSGNSGRGNMATYADLMAASDAEGIGRSYLASEETFRFLKELQSRNLLVPVVGNFGGPRALRAVGQYIRDHGATVSAFYLSNVEQYLTQDNLWGQFCANVATMPLDETSTFIRSGQRGFGRGGGGLRNELGSMLAETRGCTTAGF